MFTAGRETVFGMEGRVLVSRACWGGIAEELKRHLELVSGPQVLVLGWLLWQESSVLSSGLVSRALFILEIPSFRRIIWGYKLILGVELYLREFSMWLYI